MLDLRPNCECCDVNLPPDTPDAMICTFEPTVASDPTRRDAGKVSGIDDAHTAVGKLSSAIVGRGCGAGLIARVALFIVRL